jgi:hypothetical protein
MKIAAVRLYVLEAPDKRTGSSLKLIQVPNLLRIQYTHTGKPANQPLRQNFIEVVTDEGLVGRCTTTMFFGIFWAKRRGCRSMPWLAGCASVFQSISPAATVR